MRATRVKGAGHAASQPWSISVLRRHPGRGRPGIVCGRAACTRAAAGGDERWPRRGHRHGAKARAELAGNRNLTLRSQRFRSDRPRRGERHRHHEIDAGGRADAAERSFRLAIRGVVQNDFADHQESPAAIYVDDVYVSQMIGLAFSTFDIDRVEVLRGPQGTLFGRNATGGLAHFISRRPTDQPNGYMDVTFGQRNLLRLEGGFGGALTDGIDGGIAFQSNHYDPLFKNVFGPASDAENANDWGLRGQLLFKLPDSSQLLLLGRLSRTDVHAGSWEEYATKYIGNGVDVFVPPNENFWCSNNACPGY